MYLLSLDTMLVSLMRDSHLQNDENYQTFRLLSCRYAPQKTNNYYKSSSCPKDSYTQSVLSTIKLHFAQKLAINNSILSAKILRNTKTLYVTKNSHGKLFIHVDLQLYIRTKNLVT